MSCESSTGESLLEYTYPVSPPWEYYVDISSESSGSTDFGESSLEHICPVSPPREYYVDISSENMMPVRQIEDDVAS